MKRLFNRATIDSPEIVKDFNEGSQDAFNIIFHHYYKSLCFFSSEIIYDKESAEDIVNETFIKFWKRQGNFETLSNIKSFLYITVKNSSLNFLRDGKVKAEAHKEIAYISSPGEEPRVMKALIKSDLMRLILPEIEKLPQKRKLIFLLAYFVGLPNKEIARKLKLSVNTVKVQKARSISFLKLKFSANELVVLLFMRTVIHLFSFPTFF